MMLLIHTLLLLMLLMSVSHKLLVLLCRGDVTGRCVVGVGVVIVCWYVGVVVVCVVDVAIVIAVAHAYIIQCQYQHRHWTHPSDQHHEHHDPYYDNRIHQ